MSFHFCSAQRCPCAQSNEILIRFSVSVVDVVFIVNANKVNLMDFVEIACSCILSHCNATQRRVYVIDRRQRPATTANLPFLCYIYFSVTTCETNMQWELSTWITKTYILPFCRIRTRFAVAVCPVSLSACITVSCAVCTVDNRSTLVPEYLRPFCCMCVRVDSTFIRLTGPSADNNIQISNHF